MSGDGQSSSKEDGLSDSWPPPPVLPPSLTILCCLAACSEFVIDVQLRSSSYRCWALRCFYSWMSLECRFLNFSKITLTLARTKFASLRLSASSIWISVAPAAEAPKIMDFLLTFNDSPAFAYPYDSAAV